MAWLKLEDTFHTHPKFWVLAKLLGVPRPYARGLVSTLWSWALFHSPDGDLSEYDPEIIEAAAEWDGEPGRFVGALVKARLLDEPEMILHDWWQRAGSYKKAQAKKAERAKKQLNVRQGGDTGKNVASQKERRGDREERRGEEKKNTSNASDDAPAVRSVFEYYKSHYPQRFKKVHSKLKSWKAIKARFGDGYTPEDLKLAIDGNRKSEFHQENGHDSLELITRSAEHVDRFIAIAKEAKKPPQRLAPYHKPFETRYSRDD